MNETRLPPGEVPAEDQVGAARRREIDRLTAGLLADLANPDVRAAAWGPGNHDTDNP